MLEETRMMSISKRTVPPFRRVLGCLLGAAVLCAIVSASVAQAQTANDSIHGVTSLDVAPTAASQGVTLLKQYRDAALKQAGNQGVVVLQEADWPNRFLIYETWKDQSAYDVNETAAHTAELRDKLKPIQGAPYDRRAYHVISVGPAKAATGGETIYMQLHLDVFPPGIEKTLAAAKTVAEAARGGEGNLRYDVVRSVKPPLSHTTLFAAWQSRKAFDAYEMSAYHRQFRDEVGPLLGSPYDDRLYTPVN
jgi:quinol monooxygenase YgiN